ncbi:hypothetical protein AB0L70_25690 [Kribbella sp. NPDC051952]|uniref:hypothetical protein n=1 Tax=Kribbella sp. NPDC051952 TaxID=3154851 RepID=UPI0034473B4C
MRPLVVSSLLARLPKGMLPLTLVVLVGRQTGSYAVAGAVAALFAAGDAATAPWKGWLVDRYGAARTFVPAVVLHLLAVVGLLGLAATGLIALAGAAVATAVAAAILAGGTVAFVVAIRGSRPDRRTPGLHGALRIAAVRILCVSTLLQSMTFGVMPVALVAASTRAGLPAAAGIVQAALTFGGVVGTFRTVEGSSYLGLMARYSFCLLPLPLFAMIESPAGLVGLALTLLATGLLTTPLAAAAYLPIRTETSAGSRTEAFSWLSTGQAIGTALGSALGGALIDHGGPVAAFVVPSVAVGLAAALLRLSSASR